MTDTRTTSPDEAKAIIRLFYEALDAKDLHAAGALFADGFQMHLAGVPEPLDAAGVGKFGEDFHRAFGGLRHLIQDQTVEADIVTTRLTFSGVHQGDFAGVAATGRPVEVEAMTMHRVADGSIAEQWLLIDQASLTRQLSLEFAPPGGSY